MSNSMRLGDFDRSGSGNVDSAGSEKVLGTMPPKRKPGAPIGNANALKHGRYSKRIRAARLAALQATVKEREQQRSAWIATVPQTDYNAIVDALRALRRSKEAANVQLAEQFSDRD